MNKIDKINKYVEFRWWDGVDKRNIAGWLKNFSDKTEIGELILNNVILYSDEQLRSYTRCIVSEIQADIYRQDVEKNKCYQDDEYYNELWQESCKNMRIMPAAISQDAGSSAYEVVRRYREFFNFDIVSSIDEIPSLLSNQSQEIVFVDDFSGTGNQMKEFLGNIITIDGNEYRLGDLPNKFSNVKITVALYVIHNDALQLLMAEFPKVKVRYIDLIDDGLDFLNSESIIYKSISDEKKSDIIKYISEKKNELVNSAEFYEKMQKYQKNIPVVFQKRCPNNALILLFAKTDGWKNLFELGDRKDDRTI